MSGPYRDAQAVAVARELGVERRIAAVEADLAALRTHRQLLTVQLGRELRGHSWAPELKGVLVGGALSLVAMALLGIAFALL